jgi:hypothetical protein
MSSDCSVKALPGGIMKKITLLLLIGLNLVGCLKVKDKPQEEDSIVGAESVAFDVQVQELAKANQYRVRLGLPDGAQIVHRQIEGEPQSLISLPMNIRNGILTDEQVQAGKSYVYEAGVNQNGSFEILKKRSVQIPLDREIVANESLQKDENWTGYRRIFFNEGSTLTTNGFQLFIQADQLIAPDRFNSTPGLIRTFPAGLQAGPNQNGQSGGFIQIAVRTGKGNIKIEMRGQDGGPGSDGVSYIDPIIINGSGGPISAKANFVRATQFDGYAGGKGGDSGYFEITIQEENLLHFFPVLLLGKGGAGGKGGRTPPQGTSGVGVGADGPEGDPGKEQESWIYDSKNQVSYQ